jgi:MFS family permease
VPPGSFAFAAFHYRNYRLLWLGQLISFSGSMMQNAALLWHVSLLAPPELKGLALGLVGLMRVAPVIAFSLLAGMVADAFDRRKLMLASQAGLALIAAVLAVLTFGELQTTWPLYALTLLSASIGAFGNTARQSLIPNLVPREHLPNAISLNTIMFELASVAGPALGGLLIGSVDIGWVYTTNAASVLAVIGALLAMRDVPAVDPGGARQEVSLRAAREGLRFVFQAPMIRSTMLLDFFANFFGSAVALLPIFAQDVLRVGARGYGILYAAPSIGALLGALLLVPITDRVRRQGAVVVGAVLVYSAATVVFGLSRNFALTFLCLAVVGAADIVSTVFRNLIRHMITPDYLRGRMTSVNMIFFAGGPQLGELEAGVVANLVGAPLSVITGGVGALVATVWVAVTTPALMRYHKDDPQPQWVRAAAD